MSFTILAVLVDRYPYLLLLRLRCFERYVGYRYFKFHFMYKQLPDEAWRQAERYCAYAFLTQLESQS